MDYTLAKELKDAGFPWAKQGMGQIGVWNPTLTQLIEACGDEFYIMRREEDDDGYKGWEVGNGKNIHVVGSSSEEAVARLWLAIDEKKKIKVEICGRCGEPRSEKCGNDFAPQAKRNPDKH